MYKQCKTESSAARQRQIADALLELMMGKPYDLISVTDICKQCCLSRNSFYQYYTGKDAVLQALIDYTLMDSDLNAMSVEGLFRRRATRPKSPVFSLTGWSGSPFWMR